MSSSERNSIDTGLWGPHFWQAIHYATVDYPAKPSEAEKTSFFEFFRSLQQVLPCENCRGHYSAYWAAHDILPALESQTKLKEWALALHNAVNERLGTKKWSLGEFLTHYEPPDEEEEAKEISLMQANAVPVRVSRPPVVMPRRTQPKKTVVAKKTKCKNCKRAW